MTERTINVDLTRFTAAGFGTIRGQKAAGLKVGDVIAVTDLEADTIEAVVLEVAEACDEAPCTATIRVHWDKVLRTSL